MKNFLLLFATIISITAFAQHDNNLDCNNSSKIIKNDFQSDKSAVVIWEEDFDGGFPSGWSTYTNNTGAGNNGPAIPVNTATCPWKHSTVGSWGYWNTNQGVSAAPAINSTTASNGFLISDIDSANHWNSGQPSGDTYHFIESYFTTSAIDLTGWTNVSLEFEHSFRLNNSVNLTVAVSTDSINWTTYNVEGNATNNTASADPEYLSLNISAVAGNSSTTYVKIGWNARCYFWMIDDIKIVETPDNKLSLLEAENGGWFSSSPTTTSDYGMEYTYIPLKQIIADPYTFEGVLLNSGAINQDAQLNVEVFDGSGSSVFTTTSNSSSMAPQDTITFIGNSTFTPSNVGQYYFQTWGSSLDTISDTIVKSSTVTDSVYARDDNIDHAGRDLGSDCGEMIMGTYFDIYDNDNLSSISAYIRSGSDIGAEIVAMLYEIDQTTGDKIPISSSDDYELNSDDTSGSWITISLSEPVYAGNTYMAAIKGYASPINKSIIGRSQISYNYTSYIYDGCGDVCSGGVNTWCWTSRVHMVRMNFATVTAIEEQVFGGNISVYPNPTNGIISIDMTDVDPSNYDITITNILGEEILHINENVSGIYNNKVDLASFSKGTYIIQIANKNKVFTDKIIVK